MKNASKSALLKKFNLKEDLVSEIVGEKDFQENEPFFFFTGMGLRNDIFHLGHYHLSRILAGITVRTKAPLIYQIATDGKRKIGHNYQKLNKVYDYVHKLKNFLNVFEWGEKTEFFITSDPSNLVILQNAADYLGSEIKLKTFSHLYGNISVDFCTIMMRQLAPLLLYQKTKFLDYRPIIITAADQKGIFTMFRDYCHRFNLKKPIIIVLDPITDIICKEKMSSSSLKYAVSFDKNGISKIKKSLSEESSQKNFCVNLISKMMSFQYDENLDKILQAYKKDNSCFNLKENVIKYFIPLINQMDSKNLNIETIDILKSLNTKIMDSQIKKIFEIETAYL